MKNMILAITVLMASSAFAYPYHGGRGHYHPYPPPPSYGDAVTSGAILGSLSISTLDCSANYDCKVVEAAEMDANQFVVSNGEVRTAALDQALQTLRQAYPELANVSDMDLAIQIMQMQE